MTSLNKPNKPYGALRRWTVLRRILPMFLSIAMFNLMNSIVLTLNDILLPLLLLHNLHLLLIVITIIIITIIIVVIIIIITLSPSITRSAPKKVSSVLTWLCFVIMMMKIFVDVPIANETVTFQNSGPIWNNTGGEKFNTCI